jgi:hypothetical protein
MDMPTNPLPSDALMKKPNAQANNADAHAMPKRFPQSPDGFVKFEGKKLNGTPPSAVKSARADASLIDDVECFLQRANGDSSFDIEVKMPGSGGNKPLQDVWCRLADIMMRNYTYYERYIRTGGKIGLPPASDTVVTTAYTEQTHHVKTCGKEHTTKASEIFISLLGLYDQLNERLIIFKARQDKHYLLEKSDAYHHEVLYLKYKISGWLNLWKTMIACDPAIEGRIKAITESVPEWIDGLKDSEDSEISSAHRYYMRHLKDLRAEKDVNSVVGALKQAFLSENEEIVTNGKNETNDSSSYAMFNHNNVTGTPIVMIEDGEGCIQTKQPEFKQSESSSTILSSNLNNVTGTPIVMLKEIEGLKQAIQPEFKQSEASSTILSSNLNNVTGTPIVMLNKLQGLKQAIQPKFKQLEASSTIESSSLCPVAEKNNAQAKKLDEQKIGQKRKCSDAIACSPETGSRAQRLAIRDTLHNMYKDPKPTAYHSVEVESDDDTIPVDEYFVKSGEERIAQQSQTLEQATEILQRIEELKKTQNDIYTVCQKSATRQEDLAKRADGPLSWYASPDFRKNNDSFTSSKGFVPAPEAGFQKKMKL